MSLLKGTFRLATSSFPLTKLQIIIRIIMELQVRGWSSR